MEGWLTGYRLHGVVVVTLVLAWCYPVVGGRNNTPSRAYAYRWWSQQGAPHRACESRLFLPVRGETPECLVGVGRVEPEELVTVSK